MPGTKKRGAIFAIYADSPVQNALSASATKITQPCQAKSCSPTKRSSTRQALTALQPKAPSKKGAGDETLTKKLGGGGSGVEKEKLGMKAVMEIKQTIIPRSSHVPTTSIKPARTSSNVTRKTITKKAFEVYQESPSQATCSRLTTETTTSALSVPASSKADLANPKVSPAKRGRTISTPKKPLRAMDDQDKENKPVVDSPASRTRSKTRLSTGVAHPLGDVFVDTITSPLKSVKRTTESRRLTKIAVLADVTDAYGGSGEIPEGFTTAKR